MSSASLTTAGILLITVPTIALGGARLLKMIWSHEPGYLRARGQRSGRSG